MSAGGQNNYKLDLRAIKFTLYEHLNVQQVFEHERFSHLSREECDAILDQCVRYATEVTGPLNSSADRVGCRLENGQTFTPPGFKEAWKTLFELGFMAFPIAQDAGGFGGPMTIQSVLQEIRSGANTAFSMYSGLTHGASDVIASFGTEKQKTRYLSAMIEGRFSGTMCLSEPHAGSDVGASRTKATRLDGNLFKITGTKCWISAGDHDMCENVVHLVLARIEGAPSGTKGLSLFIVPKVWVNDDGSLGEPNDVITGAIEHKLGIRASATAVLNFGENDGCRGYLLGGEENVGIRQMFRLMNGARIAVGVQGIGVASTAYLNALSYAQERQQGSAAKNFKDPNAPRVKIIEHSDVRRMLLEMKSKVEGMRTLALKLSLHYDLAEALAGKDDAKAKYHLGQVDLLTPIVKAYCSDQAFRITELAIQTYGGAGYVEDHPVEQYCRDAKIFSIYEGTNHIQALDLVSRKLTSHGGENFKNFLQEIKTFVADHSSQPGLGDEVRALGEATEALERGAATLMDFFMSSKIDQVTLVANLFLETMAEVTIAHLLLDAAVIAKSKRDTDGDDPDEVSPEDFAFYAGKVSAAKFFVNFVMPGVHSKVGAIGAGDRSAIDIPDGGF